MVKVFFSHGKSFYVVDWLVEELGALVVKARVVVDWADDFLVFTHDDSHSVEYLVEKTVAYTNSAVCDIHNLKNFFILILDHVSVLIIEPWLESLYEFDLELSKLLMIVILLKVRDLILTKHCHFL